MAFLRAGEVWNDFLIDKLQLREQAYLGKVCRPMEEYVRQFFAVRLQKEHPCIYKCLQENIAICYVEGSIIAAPGYLEELHVPSKADHSHNETVVKELLVGAACLQSCMDDVVGGPLLTFLHAIGCKNATAFDAAARAVQALFTNQTWTAQEVSYSPAPCLDDTSVLERLEISIENVGITTEAPRFWRNGSPGRWKNVAKCDLHWECEIGNMWLTMSMIFIPRGAFSLYFLFAATEKGVRVQSESLPRRLVREVFTWEESVGLHFWSTQTTIEIATASESEVDE